MIQSRKIISEEITWIINSMGKLFRIPKLKIQSKHEHSNRLVKNSMTSIIIMEVILLSFVLAFIRSISITIAPKI